MASGSITTKTRSHFLGFILKCKMFVSELRTYTCTHVTRKSRQQHIPFKQIIYVLCLIAQFGEGTSYVVHVILEPRQAAPFHCQAVIEVLLPDHKKKKTISQVPHSFSLINCLPATTALPLHLNVELIECMEQCISIEQIVVDYIPKLYVASTTRAETLMVVTLCTVDMSRLTSTSEPCMVPLPRVTLSEDQAIHKFLENLKGKSAYLFSDTAR